MALLYCDSFDHYLTADASKKGWTYDTAGASPGDEGATIGAYGRNSTNGLKLRHGNFTNGYATLTVSGVGDATCVVGCAVNLGSVARGVEMTIFSIRNASADQITLSVSTGGALAIRRGSSGGTALATSTTTLSSSTWYFLEVKILFNDSTGTYQLWIDGVSEMSGTGADTVNSGSAGWDSIRFGHAAVTNTPDPEFSFDDLYVCDGTTGSNTSALGDHRIVCKVASSGNGGQTDWSLSTGSDHGALVDDATPNTSDYVLSGTSGQRDTFNFAALGVTGTVKAVQTVNYLKAEVAGVRSVGDVVRISSTNYDGTGVAVGSDWTYQRNIRLTDPSTSSAWTVSGIDGAEFGVKVTA